PGLALVAAGAHLVVGDGGHHHLGAVELADVAVGGGLEGDRHEPLVDVDEAVLEVPGVAPLPIRALGVRVLRARGGVERAPLLALDVGSLLPELLREPRLPDVGRLDDVIVDADDLRQFLRQFHAWTPGAAMVRRPPSYCEPVIGGPYGVPLPSRHALFQWD